MILFNNKDKRDEKRVVSLVSEANENQRYLVGHRVFRAAMSKSSVGPIRFEDSSSISSGISENFDDVSTDDLSGTSICRMTLGCEGNFVDAQMSSSARPTLFSFYRDHPMATVAATYGKLGDYQNFTRSSLKGPRSSSSNIDSRAKRIAEQENIHQLLQQCRTSQRGAACQPLRSPGYGTYGPQLALSADGETLSVHSRSSLRVTSKRQPEHTYRRWGLSKKAASYINGHLRRVLQHRRDLERVTTVHGVPSFAGYHSLDRKSHLAEYYRESSPNRLGVFDRTSMAALISPRRIPQPPPDTSRACLNSSGMSRSMVLLESDPTSPAPRARRGASPRHQQRLPLSVASPVNNK
ncbi:Dec-1 protein, region, partial [Ostertagia ostertagi]